MALTERSRTALYNGLSTIIDDEQAVQEAMSYFPARDVEEPATKEFVRAEISGLRAEMSDLKGTLRSEISDSRARVTRDLALINVGSLIALSGVIFAALRI